MRRLVFRVIIGLTALFLMGGLWAAYPLFFTNWLPAKAWLAVRTDRSPGDQVHRLHSLALAVIAWGMLVGVLLQIHRPERKVAALLVSLAVPVALAAGEMLTGTYTVAGTAPFLVPILAACILHPAARELIRLPRVDLPMLALVVIATAPWTGFSWSVATAPAAAGADTHVDHQNFMVSLPLLALLWASIGATGKGGWPFAAGAAVLATACVALQSLIFPDVLSGLSPPWAWAAVVWCIAYGSAAWLRLRRAP